MTCTCDTCTGRGDPGIILASGVSKGRVGFRLYHIHWSYSTPGLPHAVAAYGNHPGGWEHACGGFKCSVRQVFPPGRNPTYGMVGGRPCDAAAKFHAFNAEVPPYIVRQIDRNEWWLHEPEVELRRAEINEMVARFVEQAQR